MSNLHLTRIHGISSTKKIDVAIRLENVRLGFLLFPTPECDSHRPGAASRQKFNVKDHSIPFSGSACMSQARASYSPPGSYSPSARVEEEISSGQRERFGKEEREINLNYVGRTSYTDDLRFARAMRGRSQRIFCLAARARAQWSRVGVETCLAPHKARAMHRRWENRTIALRKREPPTRDVCIADDAADAAAVARHFARAYRNTAKRTRRICIWKSPARKQLGVPHSRLRVYTVDLSRVKWMVSFSRRFQSPAAKHLSQASHLSRSARSIQIVFMCFQRDFTPCNLESV